MRNFEKLRVWKMAHELHLFVRKQISVKLPPEERFSLTTQLNRAALSVPLNIAEGCGRSTNRDFSHFLHIAMGSLNEVAYCCLTALELQYIDRNTYIQAMKLAEQTKFMLIALLQFLKNQHE